jgi:hypothetical protein
LYFRIEASQPTCLLLKQKGKKENKILVSVFTKEVIAKLRARKGEKKTPECPQEGGKSINRNLI